MIYINDIPSLRDPDQTEEQFDDRIEKVELINGNTVQDYGHIESGDKFVLTCIFKEANYQRIKALWTSRTRVTYTDEAGETHANMRLVFRNARRLAKFPGYRSLSFELWKV